MDKFEIRRLNLRALLRTHCAGRAATLADKINRSPSYVSRMLYPAGKDGKKRIGEDMRNVIEDALSLARGSLDDEASAHAESRGLAPLDEEKITDEPAPGGTDRTHSSKTKTNAPASTGTTLERLDVDEKRLLELYRRSTKDGKTIIFGAATVAPKTDDLGL